MITRKKQDNKYYLTCSMCNNTREVKRETYYFYNPNKYSKNSVCIKCRKILDKHVTEEERKEYKLKWQRENRSRHNEISRKSYQKHLNQRRLETRLREYSRKNKSGGVVTKDDYYILILSTDKCNICNKNLLTNTFHIDHILPICKGGSNKIENLQLLCQFCNHSKGSKTMVEYFNYLEKIKNGKTKRTNI